MRAERLYPQIMIDLETLSSEPDAPIIQIGAVAFDIRTGIIGPGFKVNVAPDFKKTPPSLSTICWWMVQNEEARNSVAAASFGETPSLAVDRFIAFILDNCIPDAEVWAMPPEFDCVILANTIRSVDRLVPWHYAATRDLRTLESIAGMTKGDRLPAIVKHDACEDAVAQARTAVKYWTIIQARMGQS